MTERMAVRRRRVDSGALLAEEPPESRRGLLRQNLLDMSSLGEAAPPAGAAFVVDQNLCYLVAEGDALYSAGLRPEDFIGKSLFEVLEPELAARYEPRYRQVLAGGSFAEEHEAHGRVYLSRGVPLRHADGLVQAALVVSYDITDRKRAALIEERSEEVLSGLIEHAPFGVFIVDAALRVRAVNQASGMLFGEVGPLLGRELGEVLRIVGREPITTDVIGRFRHTLTTGEPYMTHTLIEGRLQAGKSEVYDWSIRRLTLPDGGLGIVCYYYDLTEVHRAEQVVAAAARRHAFLIHFSDAIAPLTDARDVARVAAAQLGQYLGVGQVAYVVVDEAADVVTVAGQWNDGFIAPDTASYGLPCDACDLLGTLRHGKSVVISDVERDLRTASQSVLGAIQPFTRASIHVPLVKDGRLRAVMSVGHASARPWAADEVEVVKEIAERTWSTTERVRAEAALRQSEDRLREIDRRKDEFLAILAHELRNPLAPIRTGLEVLRLNGDTPAVVAQVRPIMERQLAHLVRLVDDLLDVSRINSGKIQLQRQPTTLDSIVASAIEEHQLELDAAKRELVVDLPAVPVLLDVDPTRIIQVLSNLLHNSLKFTKPGDLVRIAATIDEAVPAVTLTVTDTGAGISRESLPLIFELFAQGDVINAPRGGLGLGLGLARRLLELHGGTITAASDGPGQGSALTMRLPIMRECTEPVSTAPTRDPEIRRRVLVVDDNTDAAVTMAMLIDVLGGEAEVAYNGEIALQRARTFEPDVILLDIGMPGMDGFETCRQLRARMGARMRIIALTGLGQERDKERSAAAGFDAHLTKPVDPVVLERLLAGKLALA